MSPFGHGGECFAPPSLLRGSAPKFLMLFPVVSTVFPYVDGKLLNTGTLCENSTNIAKSGHHNRSRSIQGTSRSHQECTGSIPDTPGRSLAISQNIQKHDQRFPDVPLVWTWRRVVRSTLLQVTRGRQIAQDPILMATGLGPLWTPRTFPEVHIPKQTRHRL